MTLATQLAQLTDNLRNHAATVTLAEIFPDPSLDPDGSIWLDREYREKACDLLEKYSKKLDTVYPSIAAVLAPPQPATFNNWALNYLPILTDLSLYAPSFLQRIPADKVRDVAATNFMVARIFARSEPQLGFDLATKLQDPLPALDTHQRKLKFRDLGETKKINMWTAMTYPDCLAFQVLDGKGKVRNSADLDAYITGINAGLPATTRQEILEDNVDTIIESPFTYRSHLSQAHIEHIFLNLRSPTKVKEFAEFLSPDLGWNLLRKHKVVLKTLVINNITSKPQLTGLLADPAFIKTLGISFPNDFAGKFNNENLHLVQATVKFPHLWKAYSSGPAPAAEHPLLVSKRVLATKLADYSVLSKEWRLGFEIKGNLRRGEPIDAALLTAIAYQPEFRERFNKTQIDQLAAMNPHIAEQWKGISFIDQFLQDPAQLNALMADPVQKEMVLEKIFSHEESKSLFLTHLDAATEANREKLRPLLVQYRTAAPQLDAWVRDSVAPNAADILKNIIRHVPPLQQQLWYQDVALAARIDLAVPGHTYAVVPAPPIAHGGGGGGGGGGVPAHVPVKAPPPVKNGSLPSVPPRTTAAGKGAPAPKDAATIRREALDAANADPKTAAAALQQYADTDQKACEVAQEYKHLRAQIISSATAARLKFFLDTDNALLNAVVEYTSLAQKQELMTAMDTDAQAAMIFNAKQLSPADKLALLRNLPLRRQALLNQLVAQPVQNKVALDQIFAGLTVAEIAQWCKDNDRLIAPAFERRQKLDDLRGFIADANSPDALKDAAYAKLTAKERATLALEPATQKFICEKSDAATMLGWLKQGNNADNQAFVTAVFATKAMEQPVADMVRWCTDNNKLIAAVVARTEKFWDLRAFLTDAHSPLALKDQVFAKLKLEQRETLALEEKTQKFICDKSDSATLLGWLKKQEDAQFVAAVFAAPDMQKGVAEMAQWCKDNVKLVTPVLEKRHSFEDLRDFISDANSPPELKDAAFDKLTPEQREALALEKATQQFICNKSDVAVLLKWLEKPEAKSNPEFAAAIFAAPAMQKLDRDMFASICESAKTHELSKEWLTTLLPRAEDADITAYLAKNDRHLETLLPLLPSIQKLQGIYSKFYQANLGKWVLSLKDKRMLDQLKYFDKCVEQVGHEKSLVDQLEGATLLALLTCPVQDVRELTKDFLQYRDDYARDALLRLLDEMAFDPNDDAFKAFRSAFNAMASDLNFHPRLTAQRLTKLLRVSDPALKAALLGSVDLLEKLERASHAYPADEVEILFGLLLKAPATFATLLLKNATLVEQLRSHFCATVLSDVATNKTHQDVLLDVMTHPGLRTALLVDLNKDQLVAVMSRVASPEMLAAVYPDLAKNNASAIKGLFATENPDSIAKVAIICTANPAFVAFALQQKVLEKNVESALSTLSAEQISTFLRDPELAPQLLRRAAAIKLTDKLATEAFLHLALTDRNLAIAAIQCPSFIGSVYIFTPEDKAELLFSIGDYPADPTCRAFRDVTLQSVSSFNIPFPESKAPVVKDARVVAQIRESLDSAKSHDRNLTPHVLKQSRKTAYAHYENALGRSVGNNCADDLLDFRAKADPQNSQLTTCGLLVSNFLSGVALKGHSAIRLRLFYLSLYVMAGASKEYEAFQQKLLAEATKTKGWSIKGALKGAFGMDTSLTPDEKTLEYQKFRELAITHLAEFLKLPEAQLARDPRFTFPIVTKTKIKEFALYQTLLLAIVMHMINDLEHHGHTLVLLYDYVRNSPELVEIFQCDLWKTAVVEHFRNKFKSSHSSQDKDHCIEALLIMNLDAQDQQLALQHNNPVSLLHNPCVISGQSCYEGTLAEMLLQFSDEECFAQMAKAALLNPAVYMDLSKEQLYLFAAAAFSAKEPAVILRRLRDSKILSQGVLAKRKDLLEFLKPEAVARVPKKSSRDASPVEPEKTRVSPSVSPTLTSVPVAGLPKPAGLVPDVSALTDSHKDVSAVVTTTNSSALPPPPPPPPTAPPQPQPTSDDASSPRRDEATTAAPVDGPSPSKGKRPVGLLDAIKTGVKLKKGEEKKGDKDPSPPAANDAGGIAASLAAAMAARRGAVANDEDDKNDDDDEWSDDDSKPTSAKTDNSGKNAVSSDAASSTPPPVVPVQKATTAKEPVAAPEVEARAPVAVNESIPAIKKAPAVVPTAASKVEIPTSSAKSRASTAAKKTTGIAEPVTPAPTKMPKGVEQAYGSPPPVPPFNPTGDEATVDNSESTSTANADGAPPPPPPGGAPPPPPPPGPPPPPPPPAFGGPPPALGFKLKTSDGGLRKAEIPEPGSVPAPEDNTPKEGDLAALAAKRAAEREARQKAGGAVATTPQKNKSPADDKPNLAEEAKRKMAEKKKAREAAEAAKAAEGSEVTEETNETPGEPVRVALKRGSSVSVRTNAEKQEDTIPGWKKEAELKKQQRAAKDAGAGTSTVPSIASGEEQPVANRFPLKRRESTADDKTKPPVPQPEVQAWQIKARATADRGVIPPKGDLGLKGVPSGAGTAVSGSSSIIGAPKPLQPIQRQGIAMREESVPEGIIAKAVPKLKALNQQVREGKCDDKDAALTQIFGEMGIKDENFLNLRAKLMEILQSIPLTAAAANSTPDLSRRSSGAGGLVKK